MTSNLASIVIDTVESIANSHEVWCEALSLIDGNNHRLGTRNKWCTLQMVTIVRGLF